MADLPSSTPTLFSFSLLKRSSVSAGRAAVALREIRRSVFEQEELDCHVGVAVDLAHEGARRAADDRRDRVDELMPQRVLEGGADLPNEIALAGLDQRALHGREDVLHHAHDR